MEYYPREVFPLPQIDDPWELAALIKYIFRQIVKGIGNNLLV